MPERCKYVNQKWPLKEMTARSSRNERSESTLICYIQPSSPFDIPFQAWRDGRRHGPRPVTTIAKQGGRVALTGTHISRPTTNAKAAFLAIYPWKVATNSNPSQIACCLRIMIEWPRRPPPPDGQPGPLSTTSCTTERWEEAMGCVDQGAYGGGAREWSG